MRPTSNKLQTNLYCIFSYLGTLKYDILEIQKNPISGTLPTLHENNMAASDCLGTIRAHLSVLKRAFHLRLPLSSLCSKLFTPVCSGYCLKCIQAYHTLKISGLVLVLVQVPSPSPSPINYRIIYIISNCTVSSWLTANTSG